MIEVDLRGPQGNAFWLLGYAQKLARQLQPYNDRYDPKRIVQEMQESDYENLKRVFLDYFGDYVEFVGEDDYEEDWY